MGKKFATSAGRKEAGAGARATAKALGEASRSPIRTGAPMAARAARAHPYLTAGTLAGAAAQAPVYPASVRALKQDPLSTLYTTIRAPVAAVSGFYALGAGAAGVTKRALQTGVEAAMGKKLTYNFNQITTPEVRAADMFYQSAKQYVNQIADVYKGKPGAMDALTKAVEKEYGLIPAATPTLVGRSALSPLWRGARTSFRRGAEQARIDALGGAGTRPAHFEAFAAGERKPYHEWTGGPLPAVFTKSGKKLDFQPVKGGAPPLSGDDITKGLRVRDTETGRTGTVTSFHPSDPSQPKVRWDGAKGVEQLHVSNLERVAGTEPPTRGRCPCRGSGWRSGTAYSPDWWWCVGQGSPSRRVENIDLPPEMQPTFFKGHEPRINRDIAESHSRYVGASRARIMLSLYRHQRDVRALKGRRGVFRNRNVPAGLAADDIPPLLGESRISTHSREEALRDINQRLSDLKERGFTDGKDYKTFQWMKDNIDVVMSKQMTRAVNSWKRVANSVTESDMARYKPIMEDMGIQPPWNRVPHDARPYTKATTLVEAHAELDQMRSDLKAAQGRAAKLKAQITVAVEAKPRRSKGALNVDRVPQKGRGKRPKYFVRDQNGKAVAKAFKTEKEAKAFIAAREKPVTTPKSKQALKKRLATQKTQITKLQRRIEPLDSTLNARAVLNPAEKAAAEMDARAFYESGAAMENGMADSARPPTDSEIKRYQQFHARMKKYNERGSGRAAH